MIMTSNIGARDVQDFGAGIGFETKSRADNINENLKSTIDKALQRTFNPEFINRLDDIIVFNSLTRDNLYKIIDINLEKLYKKANEIGYTIKLSKECKDFLIKKGYNPKYGARPLERAIQKYLEDVLAEEILSGNLKKGDIISADFDSKKEEIKIKKLDSKKKIK
jgi:ATP-dependent Clp protease ATP-binding subunit ClpC